jgi:hypothetical protein
MGEWQAVLSSLLGKQIIEWISSFLFPVHFFFFFFFFFFFCSLTNQPTPYMTYDPPTIHQVKRLKCHPHHSGVMGSASYDTTVRCCTCAPLTVVDMC